MTLAGKFQCYVPPGFALHERRVLYVGKATAGKYVDVDAQELYSGKSSAFWNFARSISQLADPHCKDLSNLAWSNIFKQGVVSGNPYGKTAEAQRQEAEDELRKEVETVIPTLIVMVNAGYYEEIAKAAYLIGDDELSELNQTTVQGESKYDLWSRPAHGDIPPLVWMYHPQGKRKEYLEAGIALIKKIAGW
jgi:hypothetical protein